MNLSAKSRHFFHVISNVRPIIWIGLYISLMPLFALIYWGLPEGQFRMPDGAGSGYGSWLYYSIVTITTLGFGDYTPAHGWAQTFTALEVMCGITISGFFLNAVGSMKSEIDVESEIEKQKRMHEAEQLRRLRLSTPSILHTLNTFLSYCYALTTPLEKRKEGDMEFNQDFKFSDLRELYHPSGLPSDPSGKPVVETFLKSAMRTSLFLDSLQNRVDLTLWPQLLEDCFAFVANTQMYANDEVYLLFSSSDSEIEKKIGEWPDDWDGMGKIPSDPQMSHYIDLAKYVKSNARLANNIETILTELSVKS